MTNGEPEPEGDDPDDDEGPTCRWCHGSGRVPAAVAYVAGPDPFAGPMDTVTLPTLCKHCRGTGIHEAALDPTIWDR